MRVLGTANETVPPPPRPRPRQEPSISVFWTGVVLPARINRLQQTARHLQLQTQQQHSSQPQRRLRARASPRVVTCHLPRAPLPPMSPHTDTDLYTRHCRAGGRPLLTLVTRAWTMAAVTKLRLLWTGCWDISEWCDDNPPGPGLPQRGPNKMVLVWIRIVIVVITDHGFYISECDNLNWMSIPLQL